MKIAFLNDGPYEYALGGGEWHGGLERNIWILSRALARAGWRVQVAVRGALALKERNVIEGVEYIGIGQGPLAPGQILMEWYRFLSSERPDWLFWGRQPSVRAACGNWEMAWRWYDFPCLLGC